MEGIQRLYVGAGAECTVIVTFQLGLAAVPSRDNANPNPNPNPNPKPDPTLYPYPQA